MGEYIVSARKYRPATFDEVVGQEHVTSTLKTALHKGQLAQAYLFTGPRGVGKTTCARILAKVVNCENPIDGNTACDQCESCKAFNENVSFNIFELDAASNNSVDQMRSLIDEQVRYAPQKGKYKVFIIDEVHMLSKQAFNAFLKTLEEPPPHAIFILATTEKHKIIPTILSRCQIYDFKSIGVKDIIKQLELISEKENITVGKDALNLIAYKADGAMRDALSIFDRIVSSSPDNTIVYKQVLDNLKMLDYDYYFKMVEAIIQKDLSTVFLLFDEIIKEGYDINLFVLGLAEHFRQLLVSKDPRTQVLLEIGDDLKQRYINQSKIVEKGFALTSLSILNKCDYTFPVAQNKRLHVEIALSKVCHIEDAIKMPQSSTSQKKKIISPVSKQKDSTKEHSLNNNNEKSKSSHSEKNEPIDTNPKPEIKEEDINQDKANEAKTEEKSQKEEPEINKNPVQTINTPIKRTLGGFPKLGELLEEVKKEESNAKEKLPIDIDKISLLVDDMINTHTSKMVINTLKELQFEEDNDTLNIYVPTQLSKDILLNERKLIEKIKEIHYNPGMEIKIMIDLTKFPDHKEIKTEKKLTTKEKYELLINKNPLIADFIKDFDLHIDS